MGVCKGEYECIYELPSMCMIMYVHESERDMVCVNALVCDMAVELEI